MADDGDELLAQPRRRRLGPGWYALGALVIAAGVLVAVLNRNRHDTPAAQPSHLPTPTRVSPTSTQPTPSGAVVLGGFNPSVHGDFQLYARAGNALLHFNFAKNRVVSSPLPPLQSTGPVAFLATSHGAIVRPVDAVPGYLVPDGEPARNLRGVLSRSAVLPGPDPDHVWIYDDLHGSTTMRLVDTNGQHPGPPLRLPQNPYNGWTPDGSGYLLVDAKGGLFDVRPEGAHLIARGPDNVVAAGGDRLLVTTCARGSAPHAACPAYVVSARTGKRRSLAPLPAGQAGTQGPIASDGRTAAVFTKPSPGTVGVRLVDLATGKFRGVPVRVDPDVGTGSAVFSPDGRWVFIVGSGNALLAVDAATGAVHTLGSRLPGVFQLAIRAG